MGKSIPADATRQCPCGNGTQRPTGAATYEATGSANVRTACDRPVCNRTGQHYWQQ